MGALIWIAFRPGDETGGWRAAHPWILPSLPPEVATGVATAFWIVSMIGFVDQVREPPVRVYAVTSTALFNCCAIPFAQFSISLQSRKSPSGALIAPTTTRSPIDSLLRSSAP